MKSLDILIGVSAVMLTVSMFVTVITHIITTLLNTRGGHLRRGLADILRQIDPAVSDKIAKQISSAALRHPLVNDVTWRLGTVLHREEFTKILLELASGGGAGTLKQEAKDVLADTVKRNGIKDPAATLDRIREFALDLERSNPAIGNDVRSTLAILNKAESQLVAKINGWFDQTIDRVQARFTASTRVITVFAALLVATFFQLDTIGLVNRLWIDQDSRKALVADATKVRMEYEQKEKERSAKEAQPTPALASPPSGGAPPAASVDAKATGGGNQVQGSSTLDQVLGDAGVIAWPPADWKTVRALGVWQKLLGVLLSTALLSLGAPFWYDMLKTTLRFRSSLSEKDDAQRERRQTNESASPASAGSPGTRPVPATTMAVGERGEVNVVG